VHRIVEEFAFGLNGSHRDVDKLGEH
jgi:hypothetical protein